MGAPVLVDDNDLTDPLEIAMLELKSKKIPIVIRRYLPDGSFEDWAVEDLIIEWNWRRMNEEEDDDDEDEEDNRKVVVVFKRKV